ncbi:hypothetical protein ABT124_03315 [Streptomyces sp. NPDC001982]|uniref:hypothetical protein n=1 Tax=Streptomyces sp. NPDC001982 TaxID=3154405 RepID=UPI0033193194
MKARPVRSHPMKGPYVSPLIIAAITVALIAVVAMIFGLPDSWFCGLLALACALIALDTAYREVRLWALVSLAAAAVLTGAGVHAAYANGRARREDLSTCRGIDALGTINHPKE